MNFLKVANPDTGQIIGILLCPDFEWDQWRKTFRIIDRSRLPSLKEYEMARSMMNSSMIPCTTVTIRRHDYTRDIVFIDIDPFEMNKFEGWAFIPYSFVPIKKEENLDHNKDPV